MSMCSYKSLCRNIYSRLNASFSLLSKSLYLGNYLNGDSGLFICIYKSLCTYASTSPSVEHPSEPKQCVHIHPQVPLWEHPSELHHVQVQSTCPFVESSIWTSEIPELYLIILQLWTFKTWFVSTISILICTCNFYSSFHFHFVCAHKNLWRFSG